MSKKKALTTRAGIPVVNKQSVIAWKPTRPTARGWRTRLEYLWAKSQNKSCCIWKATEL